MSCTSPLRQAIEDYARSAASQHIAVPAAAASRPGAAVGRRIESLIEYIPYGVSEQGAASTCEILATLGDVEVEYAAIRRTAGVFDSPHRGTLMVTGSPAERRDFFNRLVTQELKTLQPGEAREAFWLNRKGRIDADLFLLELGDRMIIDVDVHQAAHAAESLAKFVFSEDVAIANVSDEFHHLAIHGRNAPEIVSAAFGITLDPLRAATARTSGAEVFIARRDQTGEPGYVVVAARSEADAIFTALLQSGSDGATSKARVRPIGWHAYNIARIEAGTPLMNVDFGPTNLPHETGILEQRVSFTKGCYVGQEVVARMQNLGKPKQMLIGLRLAKDLLPVAGAQVFVRTAEGGMGEQIGVITSSTLSPMLSAAPIAFAMMRTAHAQPGGTVLANAEGETVEATVSPLRFWPARQ